MLAERDAQLAAQSSTIVAQSSALADRDSTIAAQSSALAERSAAVAAATERYRRAQHLYELEKRRVRVDDVLQYVALTGHTSDAALAFGLCRDFWRDDVQFRWAAVKGRHGEWKMTRLMWACWMG